MTQALNAHMNNKKIKIKKKRKLKKKIHIEKIERTKINK
jgi:hypothetical protein